MNTFLARIQPTRDTFPGDGTTEEFALVGAHFNRLKQATDDGLVIFCGRYLDDQVPLFGYILFRAESLGAAHAWMSGDPAVINGVFKLIDVRPIGIATFGSYQED